MLSLKEYRKIPKISPGPFLRVLFLEGLIFEGASIGLYLEGNLSLKIDWASLLLEGNLCQ